MKQKKVFDAVDIFFNMHIGTDAVSNYVDNLVNLFTEECEIIVDGNRRAVRIEIEEGATVVKLPTTGSDLKVVAFFIHSEEDGSFYHPKPAPVEVQAVTALGRMTADGSESMMSLKELYGVICYFEPAYTGMYQMMTREKEDIEVAKGIEPPMEYFTDSPKETLEHILEYLRLEEELQSIGFILKEMKFVPVTHSENYTTQAAPFDDDEEFFNSLFNT